MENETENIQPSDAPQETFPADRGGATLPMAITLIALLIYFAFQTLQLVSERSNLASVRANQEAALQESQKVQTQFKTLVTQTSELANQGHAGAKMVIDELQKRGVGVPPPAKPADKLEAKPAK